MFCYSIADEYNDAGLLVRTCGGDVSVTKCEGFCNSQVQPSVITTTGFLKVSQTAESPKNDSGLSFVSSFRIRFYFFFFFSGMLLLP